MHSDQFLDRPSMHVHGLDIPDPTVPNRKADNTERGPFANTTLSCTALV
jgi:hypothetical protein